MNKVRFLMFEAEDTAGGGLAGGALETALREFFGRQAPAPTAVPAPDSTPADEATGDCPDTSSETLAKRSVTFQLQVNPFQPKNDEPPAPFDTWLRDDTLAAGGMASDVDSVEPPSPARPPEATGESAPDPAAVKPASNSDSSSATFNAFGDQERACDKCGAVMLTGVDGRWYCPKRFQHNRTSSDKRGEARVRSADPPAATAIAGSPAIDEAVRRDEKPEAVSPDATGFVRYDNGRVRISKLPPIQKPTTEPPTPGETEGSSAREQLSPFWREPRLVAAIRAGVENGAMIRDGEFSVVMFGRGMYAPKRSTAISSLNDKVVVNAHRDDGEWTLIEATGDGEGEWVKAADVLRAPDSTVPFVGVFANDEDDEEDGDDPF